MDDDNRMQTDFGLPQLTRIGESPMTFGEAKPDVVMNMEMAEDQLSRFMARAMTLHSSSAPKFGTFVGCTARFNGTRNEQELQKFILNVTLYKDAEGIDDEIALHELPLLLEGEAAIWWTGIKENIYVWSEALKMLQIEFSPKKPAYEIYAEVFATKQDEYTLTELFIRQKQALLNALPRPLPEDVQIDMIYSLLRSKIQNKIPREKVATLDQLIMAANHVEHKKNKKRVKRFKNLDYKTVKPVIKSKENFLHWRTPKGSGLKRNREVDCFKWNSLRPKRSEDNKQHNNLTTINLVNVIPLCGFNPDSNPFSK